MNDVKKYIDNLNVFQKNEFQKVRLIVKKLLPDSELMVSYGVLAFKHNKKPVVYFGGFKDHTSLFPASDEMIAAVGPELERFRSSKGTLQFSESNPLPDKLLQKIIQFRVDSL